MLQVQLHSSCLHESYNVTSLALMKHTNVTSAAAFLLLARTIQMLLVQLLSYCSQEPYKCYLCSCISLASTNHTYVTSAAAFLLLARTIQMLLVQLLSSCLHAWTIQMLLVHIALMNIIMLLVQLHSSCLQEPCSCYLATIVWFMLVRGSSFTWVQLHALLLLIPLDCDLFTHLQVWNWKTSSSQAM